MSHNSCPAVSVVIAFYNAERFLQEAVESVIAQTYPDWEIVLVNDGSTDRSAAIAASMAERSGMRIRCLEHAGGANRGACASRNLGARQARGRMLAILDSDDVWLPHKLAEQVALLERYPEAGMVFGKPLYWSSWAADTSSSDVTPPLWLQAGQLYRPPTLLLRCHPLGSAGAPCPSDLLFRREVMERIGGFEESFTGARQLYEDQAFLSKAYLDTPVFVSDATWTHYRLHDDSCSSRVTGTSAESDARRFYLLWLHRWLDEHRVASVAVRKALQRAQWLDRHPRLARVNRDLRRALFSARRQLGARRTRRAGTR